MNKEAHLKKEISYKYIKSRAEAVYTTITTEKTAEQIKNIIEEYLSGELQDNILLDNFPDEYQKGSHVLKKAFQMLLDNFADPKDRERRHNHTKKNLQYDNPFVQQERGRLGGLKKTLSPELAAEMGRKSHDPLTDEQRDFVYNFYQTTEGNRNFRCERTAKKLKEVFDVDRTGSIRGVIARYKSANSAL